MAITSNILLDIANSTQSITYTLASTQVDQITYSSNSITFGAISSFNINKSDLLLYINNLNLFLNVLITNFPIVQNSTGISLPLSTFAITLSTAGVEHIFYTQTSQGVSVYNTNYLPSISQASMSTRAAVTVTLQEFILCCNLLVSYAAQINLN